MAIREQHHTTDERVRPVGHQRPGARAWRAGGLALLAALVAALAGPGVASAHASYKSSDPKANAILKAAPTLVTVHFVENVNPQGSDIIVYDATGKQVSTAPAQVERADLTTMTVPMQGSDAEIYIVVWHTVSADDGDPDIGAFNFLVNPKASTIQAVTGGGHASAASSSGMPIWVGALFGVLGLIVGAGGWFLVQRSRASGTPPASSATPS